MAEAGATVDRLAALAALAEGDPEALLVVVGPTASGKTALAVTLAERLGGEIVSADSVQIYRGFDVGSGKPTAEERARAPHHLVDALDPLDAVDAARFAAMADACITEVRARGRRPIVCGGTYLWTKALLQGLAAAPGRSAELRARHETLATSQGRAALHEALARVDPPSAARLHPNDFVRTSRALEVFELTGKPMSEWQAEHGFREPRHRAHLVGLRQGSSALTARIEARVARWLAEGWVDEVRALLARGYGDARAMGSVGYREVRQHVEGTLAEGDLALAIVRATRVFARRQRTWLRDEPVTWLSGDDDDVDDDARRAREGS